jgi:glucose/arabinose dehydrogenase
MLLYAQQPDLELELVSNAFNSPVDIQNAGDSRLFIVEKGGRIRILNDDGSVNTTPFLDISGQVSGGSEQGLLGLTFHPNYSSNGFFYVNYTDNAGNTQVSRFSVDPGDPDLALGGSELNLLTINQPFSNHNAGSLAFGPDGYLYITSGDGGSGGDPQNNGQNTATLLGKMLRIDVDNPSGGNNYGIPADNPFAGSTSERQEIWAYGLRNPWKFSFDHTSNDIWIADVGQGEIEEMNKQPVFEAGLNYGWRCYEGSEVYNNSGCPDPSTLTFPEAEYTHAGGNCSVTGGYVYRGSDWPVLTGYYFAADLCSGRIFTVDQNGNLIDHGSFGGTWVSFGEDFENELYIADIGGEIFRITDNNLIGTTDFTQNRFKLYPNPASGRVYVQSTLKLDRVRIINLLGTEVLNRSRIDRKELSMGLEQVKSGLYLIEMTDIQGNRQVEKLIIR